VARLAEINDGADRFNPSQLLFILNFDTSQHIGS